MEKTWRGVSQSVVWWLSRFSNGKRSLDLRCQSRGVGVVLYWTLTIVIWDGWRTELVQTAVPVFVFVHAVSITVERRCECQIVCFREPKIGAFHHFTAAQTAPVRKSIPALQAQKLSATLSYRGEGGFSRPALFASDLNFIQDLEQASIVASGSRWHVGQRRKFPWLSGRLNRF